MVPKKLNLIIFSTIIISTILLLISISLDIKYEKNHLNKQLNFLESSIKNEYKKRLKESVTHAMIFIETLYTNKLKEQKIDNPNLKELTPQNKKIFLNTAKSYFHNTIFEKSRYLWVNKIINFKGGDKYAIRLIHPNLKETEGSFLTTKEQDIKGNLPYLKELEGIKKYGEIYFTYYFKQLNKDEITEKMSYAKLYKRMNWIIATGIPINDLNKIITLEKIKFEKQYQNHIIKVLSLRILILILFIILLLILRKKLSKAIDKNIILNKKLEHKLKRIETNFDKFFELPSTILLISDFEGHILEVNKGWKKILGYEKEEILNTSFIKLVHPNDVSLTLKELEKLSHGETTFYFENRYKHKNGEYKTLAWSANSLPENKLLYAMAQDITELKEKSNIMYQQSKMAAMGEMTANIAHQWRQPLSIISTASSGILLKKMADDLDEQFLINTMNQITQSTQYLSDTIEGFRNFYTPYKEQTTFTIDYIFTKTLDLVKKRYDNDNIKIIKEIEDIKIKSFENELLQVIINLLNNARDQLIKLDLEKKLIFIKAYKKDKQVFIEIIDNGNGIKEDIINRIFEPYFTTKNKAVGTGIGLYMSEEITTKHLKGKLLVKNSTYIYEEREYKGAKFTIILELKD